MCVHTHTHVRQMCRQGAPWTSRNARADQSLLVPHACVCTHLCTCVSGGASLACDKPSAGAISERERLVPERLRQFSVNQEAEQGTEGGAHAGGRGHTSVPGATHARTCVCVCLGERRRVVVLSESKHVPPRLQAADPDQTFVLTLRKHDVLSPQRGGGHVRVFLSGVLLRGGSLRSCFGAFTGSLSSVRDSSGSGGCVGPGSPRKGPALRGRGAKAHRASLPQQLSVAERVRACVCETFFSAWKMHTRPPPRDIQATDKGFHLFPLFPRTQPDMHGLLSAVLLLPGTRGL